MVLTILIKSVIIAKIIFSRGKDFIVYSIQYTVYIKLHLKFFHALHIKVKYCIIFFFEDTIYHLYTAGNRTGNLVRLDYYSDCSYSHKGKNLKNVYRFYNYQI